MKPTLIRLRAAVSCLVLWFSLVGVQAQMRVGQPAGTPDPSAALEVSGGPYANGSPYRGIAPPKVALTQTASATPVTNPVTGLLVYNTAKGEDVTPGYYYWEGNKWVRLNAYSNSGAARTATLNAGDPVPEYTISQVRSWTTTPGSYSSTSPTVFMLVDQGKEGLFRYDPSDVSTLDNTGCVLVTLSGLRYKRIISGGQLQVEWYGAKGDGVTDDTQAIQAAIDDALTAAPSFYGGTLHATPVLKSPGTVLFPIGTFSVGTLHINGSIRLLGQGGGTYAGSFLLQNTPGISLVELGPDSDGSSNSTVIENLMFKSSTNSTNPAVAQIKTIDGINSNSVYIRNCWFQTPENLAIWLTQGDDIQISGCTFDIIPYHAIRLGNGSGHVVSNCTILNNTFVKTFQIHIWLDNTVGTVIQGNRAYYGETISTATFIDGASGDPSGRSIRGLTITGNETSFIPSFAKLPTYASGVVISANSATNLQGYFLALTGGGVLYSATVTGNSVSTNTNFSSPPIDATSCGVQGSVISGNSFISTTVTSLGMAISDNRIYGNNFFGNTFTNITTAHNSTLAASNQLPGTMFTQNASNVAITNGSASFSALSTMGNFSVGTSISGSSSAPAMLEMGNSISSSPGMGPKIAYYKNGSTLYSTGVSANELWHFVPSTVAVNNWYFGGQTASPFGVINSGARVLHLIGSSGSLSAPVGLGAGTSPVISISGSDIAHLVTLTEGTAPPTGSISSPVKLYSVTFATPYASAPYVSFSQGDLTTAAVMSIVAPANVSTAGYDVMCSGTLMSGKQYKFMAQVIQ